MSTHCSADPKRCTWHNYLAVAALQRVRDVVDAPEALQLRRVSRGTLSFFGSIRLHRHELAGPMHLSAEAAEPSSRDEAPKQLGLVAVAASSSSASIPAPVALYELGNGMVDPHVRLSPTMHRCLAVLHRFQRELPNTCGSRRRSVAALADLFGRLAQGILCGHVSSAARFVQLARAAQSEAVLAAWDQAEELEEGYGEVRLVSMTQKLDRDLLLVDVPEFECTRVFLGSTLRPAVSLEIRMAIRCLPKDSFSGSMALVLRYLWVDVFLVDEAGFEIPVAPRVRFSAKSRARQGTSEPFVVDFDRRIGCGADVGSGEPLKLLNATGAPAHELKVAVRADWPLLQRFKLEVCHCQVVIADLYAK